MSPFSISFLQDIYVTGTSFQDDLAAGMKVSMLLLVVFSNLEKSSYIDMADFAILYLW